MNRSVRYICMFFLMAVLSGCGEPTVEPLAAITTTQTDYNALVLSAIQKMPSGGGYSTTKATDRLRQSAVSVSQGNIVLRSERAKPSYCSGATYLVFLQVMQTLQQTNRVKMSNKTLSRLAIADAKDGVEPWGRWNSNGPGTAKFFKDTGLGVSFAQLDRAKPGDFLKIFWTEKVGKYERGHSVVFLGRTATELTFWSSNEGAGYGTKTVSLSSCKRLLFSRLTTPASINQVARLPLKDAYLESMLTQDHAVDWSKGF